MVTMTDGYGKPIRRRYSGEIYKHKLEQSEDTDVIAKRLTMSIYRWSGFNRPLIYPSIGVS
jgi:hypothetical protein